MKKKIKENGKVYTPQYIVNDILQLSGYYGKHILKKHIIDNSCGDGAFLTEIVKKYCIEAKKHNLSNREISNDLSTYIHGIELDQTMCSLCIKNLNRITNQFDIFGINWDIRCDNTLLVSQYNGKMDYVVGNPPYIRIHNLGKSCDIVKKFNFSQHGMTDIFIAFYEIGLKMLNKNGVLGYITPSSFFNSVAGNSMRKYFVSNKLLQKVVDLKHFQAFDAVTYTTIIILSNSKNSEYVEYYEFDNNTHLPVYIDNLKPDDFYIMEKFFFSNKKNLETIKKIATNIKKTDIQVKNGYATLSDKVFINNFDFTSKYIIPVVKSSKGTISKIIYPYDEHSNIIDELELKQDFKLYNYLISNKEKLLSRSFDKNRSNYWYGFGRNQAIHDTYKNKIAINSLLRNYNDLKLTPAPSGTGVYGGLYIISNKINIEEIENVLKTQEFIDYISLLGKYKNGGYYSFSSKDLKLYLDYIFTK